MKKLLVSILTIGALIISLSSTAQAGEKEGISKKSAMKNFRMVPKNKTTLLQDGKNKDYCPICGMTLPMFYKTNHATKHKGHDKQYCSIVCVVEDAIVNGKKLNKTKRIEETIKRSFEPISRKEIHLIWPDISHETIKKVVKTLLNENKIKKIGNFKDARYKRNWYGDRSEDEENVVIF